MKTQHHFPEPPSGAACDAVAPLLPLVAQRLLEPAEAEAVRAHVSGCGFCRARLAAYDRLDNALRRRFEQLASSPIRMEELMSRVQYEEQYDRIEEPTATPVSPAPSALPRAARRSPRRVFSWVAAIAAMLVIALITTALFVSHHPSGVAVKPKATASPAQASVSVYGSAYTTGDSPDSTIFALDGATGKQRWANKSDTTRMRPFVEHGVFYIAASNGSADAYRASDGTLLWSQKSLSIMVIEQVVDGVVYAVSFDNATQQYSLYALDGRTGQVRWHFTKGADPQAVVDGTVYVVSEGDALHQHETVYALNASDGSVRWEFQTQGSVTVAEIVDGQVYLIEDRSDSSAFAPQLILYAVAADSGQQRWSGPQNPVVLYGWLGVDNGLVYILSNTGEMNGNVSPGELYALNASDGSVRWHIQLETGHLLPIYSNGVIYISSVNDLSAYRASDGHLLWSNPAIRAGWPDMVVNGVLYLDGAIAVDTSTGNILWQRTADKPVLVKAVVNGLVYGVSDETASDGSSAQVDNAVYALDVATGQVRWTYDVGPHRAFYLVAG